MYEEPNGNHTVLPTVIKYKFTATNNCAIPVCALCLLARSKKRSPGVNKVKPLSDIEGDLERDKYELGHFFPTDQFKKILSLD